MKGGQSGGIAIRDALMWQKVAGGAAILTALAAFLPWASVFGISVAGIHGDGQITLIVAAIGVGVLLLANRRGRPQPWRPVLVLVVESVGGAIVALVALADMNTFSAIGLHLTLIGGLIWIGAAVFGWLARRRSPAVGAVSSPATGLDGSALAQPSSAPSGDATTPASSPTHTP